MSCPDCHRHAIEVCEQLISSLSKRFADTASLPTIYLDTDLKAYNDQLLKEIEKLKNEARRKDSEIFALNHRLWNANDGLKRLRNNGFKRPDQPYVVMVTTGDWDLVFGTNEGEEI